MQQPEHYTDGNILLRPFSAEDIPAVFEAVRESIGEVAPWLPWCHPDYAIEETRDFIMSREEARTNGTDYGFGIFDAKTGEFLGGVGLSQINRTHQMGNLGYWVRTSRAGRGIASSAARLAARFALEELKLQRVEILAATGNLASQRVALKAGAVREGVLRKRLINKGQTQDAVLFSLVAEDLGVSGEQ
ncbi:MAG TPA: GNAT family protein [Pyrinomonadaceae bacterium]|nr:GNAT family protein [Pyrinomonadaceae bacterium]